MVARLLIFVQEGIFADGLATRLDAERERIARAIAADSSYQI
jgi:hypothetical protein